MGSEIALPSSGGSGVGLVLSGGGAKGAYQVGVVRCLADMGVSVSAVAGASVGALNGAIVVSSPDLPEASRRLDAIWRELGDAPPAELRVASTLPPLFLGYYLTLLLAARERTRLQELFRAVKRIATLGGWSTGGENVVVDAILRTLDVSPEVVAGERLEVLIERHLSVESLSAGVPFFVSVFRSHSTLLDLAWVAAGTSGLFETPASEYLHVQRLPPDERRRAILASAALPLLFEAQAVGGSRYSDGGLGGWLRVQGNTPLAPLLQVAGCEIVIVTHLTDGSFFDRHAFPSVTLIEIRPNSPISRKGGLRDTIGFDSGMIESWIEQGYQDTYKRISQITDTLGVVTLGNEARARRATAIQNLLEADVRKLPGER